MREPVVVRFDVEPEEGRRRGFDLRDWLYLGCTTLCMVTIILIIQSRGCW